MKNNSLLAADAITDIFAVVTEVDDIIINSMLNSLLLLLLLLLLLVLFYST
jgi:hypothetical protein